MRKPKNLGRQALNKRSDRPRLKACDAQNMGHNRPHAVGFPIRKPKNLGRQALNKRSGRPRLKACDAQNMGHNRPHAVGFPIRDTSQSLRIRGRC
jgi:hypothetical protein